MSEIFIRDILAHLQTTGITAAYRGDLSLRVQGFSSLVNYRKGTFTWVKRQENWENRPIGTEPLLVFVQQGVSTDCPNQIVTAQSKHAFFETIEHFFNLPDNRPPIGAGTFVAPSVRLGERVQIGCNCTIEGDITIGDGTVIENNVTIQNRVTVGKDCFIQSGCRIGGDGFAYTEDEQHRKTMVKHFGGVRIEDNVYIGTNCVVDRSEIDDTVLEEGCKIDPLVHIAHNVHLSKNCTVIACTNIMGSVFAGENAYISSSVIRNQCSIGKNAVIGMGAVVIKDVPPDTTVVGNPAKPFLKAGDTQ